MACNERRFLGMVESWVTSGFVCVGSRVSKAMGEN